MADDITVPGTGAVLAFDEVDGVKHQRVKVQHGANGSATDVSSASPMPVSAATFAVAFTEPINGADAVVVSTSTAEVLAANAARVEATVCNDHSANVVYLALGVPAVSGQGIRLNAAGGSYTTPPGYKGTVNAIATGSGTNVCFVEA